MRYSVTTNRIHSGLNVVEVKYLLGHTNLESTSGYLHHAMEETRSKVDKTQFQEEESSPHYPSENGNATKQLALQMTRAAEAGNLQLVRALS